MFTISRALLLSAAIGTFMGANAFQNDCNNNIAMYWGQNSYGATNAADKANWQKSLKYYCDDDSIDIIPIAFLTTFFSKDGLPSINLANTCNNVDNSTFPETELPNCSALAEDIEYCQSKGKALTLSLGGATGGVGFQSDSQATEFADTIWNVFLGGSSSTRPFGKAILDGIDLDIEGGGSNYYTSFLKKLDSHFSSSSKKYYVTAAPQCVYPDANLGNTINNYPFDAIYVQFYNNPCGLQTYGQANNWNYGLWDYWAQNISPNKDVKVYIGAPASSSAAGGGYVSGSTLQKIAEDTQKSFPSFGGVMFWDASQAYANGKIHAGIKSSMGGCSKGFTYPECSAPAWESGKTYSAGQKVSYKYIWTAKWSASEAPKADAGGNWIPTSACKGGSSGGDSSSSGSSTVSTSKAFTSTSAGPISTTETASETPTSAPTTTTKTLEPSTTTTTATISPTTTSSYGNGGSGSCNGVSAWSATETYTQGSKVVYGNKVWVASQWSYNDVPGGSSGVWKSQGACTADSAAAAKAAPLKRNIGSENCEANLAQVWKQNKVYLTNARTLYKGTIYRAQWFNTNAEPGKSSAWEADEACTSLYFQRRKLQLLRR